MPELYPFQGFGAGWLAARRWALLADEMGLGKSPQAIAAADMIAAPVVTILCPAIMCQPWRETIEDFGDIPRRVQIIRSTTDAPEPRSLVICSYDKASRSPQLARALQARGGVFILDEAHACKDPSAGRTKAVYGPQCDGRGGIVQDASHVWALTATPTPNNCTELFPFLRASGVWHGTYRQFVERFAITMPTDYGFRVVGQRNMAELRARLQPLMLRRLAAEVLTLPEIETRELGIPLDQCDIDPELASQLVRLEEDYGGMVGDALQSDQLGQLDTPNLSTLRRLIGQAKAGPVCDLVKQTLLDERGAKVVLFCLHKTTMDSLAEGLRGFGVVQLRGGISEAKRTAARRAFQLDARTRVAVCQIKAAGVGITLTAANWLWLVEPSWSPADNDQAIKRIHRIGQRRRVNIRLATLIDSVDDAVNGVLRRKVRMIAETMART